MNIQFLAELNHIYTYIYAIHTYMSLSYTNTTILNGNNASAYQTLP